MPYKAYQPKPGATGATNNGNQATVQAQPPTAAAPPQPTMAKPEHTFRIGDPVWAKMKGFPAWPGRIDPPELAPQALKKGAFFVYFFGSNNYAPIMETDLKPYLEYKGELGSKIKQVNLKKAIEEIENFLAGVEEPKAEEKPAKQPATQVASSKPASPAKSAPTTPSSKLSKAALHNDEMAEAEFEALLTKPVKKDDGSSTPKSTKRPHSDSNAKSLMPSKKIKIKTKPKLRKEDEPENVPIFTNKKSASVAVSSFLDRPVMDRPASPSLTLTNNSKILSSKDVKPTSATVGFLGLGIIGSGIVNNLLNSGHNVVVWNRTTEKCDPFVRAGAKSAITPGDVVAECDITFSCISDPAAAKEIVFGNCGVLSEINVQKSYVEMTGIDSETSKDIAEAISLKCGRYLEAQVQGSKMEALDGTLVILAAGDRSLFDDCQSCFQAMSKETFYLGDVGNASKMNLVIQLMSGVALAGLAEAMALGDRAGLQQKDILDILKLTSLSCPLINEKSKAIIEGGFPTHHPLQHLQKDLKLSLMMADALEQPLPLTAAANEVFKHAKRLGYGEHDSSAVYIRARF